VIVDSKRTAGRFLENLLSEVGPVEMGFRIQGLAAQIILALGYRVLEVKSSGHPDLVAQAAMGIVRVEIEADTMGSGVHLPEPKDLTALCPQSPGDEGYFAIAICSLFPRWIVIDSNRLVDRKTKLVLPLLESLSNREQSEIWSELFEQLILDYGNRLVDFSFTWLVEQALEQRCLIQGNKNNPTHG
jgi:hypothetical protein